MTDIQPLTDEELSGPYGRVPKVWCCSDCRYRWEERLLATIDAKDAEIARLREVARAFVAINECACPTPDDMPFDDDLTFPEWIKENRCYWHQARAALEEK